MDELSKLMVNGRKLLTQCKTMKDQQRLSSDPARVNIPRQLSDLRSECTHFVKGITRFKRTAATHLMVFMISHEHRDRKPYALPVQCLPYTGLSEAKMRSLANEIIKEMVKRNMKVAG